MKQLTCELCGSTNFIKQDGSFTCQSCGMKYSVEEAQKMMADGKTEVSNTVKTENTKRIDNLYQLARRAKESQDTQNALKYYDMILLENPNDWEAMLYSAYFTAMQGTLGSLISDCQTLKSKLKSILIAIRDNVQSDDERIKCCREACESIQSVTEVMFVASKNDLFEHYERFQRRGTSAYSAYAEHCEECMVRVHACYSVLNTFGDLLEELFDGEDFKALSRIAWKIAMEWNRGADDLNSESEYVRIFKRDQLEYTGKIKNAILSAKANNDLGIPGVDSATAEKIANLVKSGQTIVAIKEYREATEADLAEAKAVIDNYKKQIGMEVNPGNGPKSGENQNDDTQRDKAKKQLKTCLGIGCAGFICGFLCVLSGAPSDNIKLMTMAFPLFIAALISFIYGAVINSKLK